MKRCRWCNLKNEKYVIYHDQEWGVLCLDDHYLFEMLILESFQAGLSWECILNKREAFCKAYDNFDIEKVVLYDEKKIEELRNNSLIVRNRLKIIASIENAKIFKNVQKEFGSFSNYLMNYTNGEIIIERDCTTNDLSDAISRDNLIVLGNYNYGWLGEPDYDIEHGGDYPTAIYVDHNGNFYQKAWDLNDYGPDAQGNSGVKYKLFDKYIASAIDKIGSPTVTTTGYQRIPYNNDTAPIIDKMMAARGLYPTIDGDNVYWGAKDFVLTPGDKAMWQKYMRNISEGNSYKDGKSPIHIKPANRGKLTRLKKRTGKSEAELYRTGSAATRKMITFARNARKWRH